MPRKKKMKPDILGLFGQAESALAEIERNLGDSPQNLEKRLSDLSWKLRSKKEALLGGLLEVAKNLGLAGPFRVSNRGRGRSHGWIRLEASLSTASWLTYTTTRHGVGSQSMINVFALLTDGKYSHLYTPLCEALMQNIEKAIADLAPTSRSYKRLLRVLQKATSEPKRPR